MPLLDSARSILSMILPATASLAVVASPTHFLWMAADGVTELGHALTLCTPGLQ